MRKTIFGALPIFLLIFTAVLTAGEKKSLLIMFDGLRGDMLCGGETPNIDALRDGRWAEGYHSAWTYQAHTNLDANPSSATNHVAIITGVTATKNGCFNNGQTKDAKWGEYPSYLARLKKIDPNLITVWLYNWSENADFVTDATFTAAPRGGFGGDMKICDDVVKFLNDDFPEITDFKGNVWDTSNDPDVLAVYLDSMDMYGHSEGFSVFVPEYCQKITQYDTRVGDILAAIKARPRFADEDWQIIIVADHGGFRTGHGIPLCENCYTVPLIVSSKEVSPGRMVGQPQNCDAAAYVMQHFTGSVPADFDGKIEKTIVDPAPNINESLVAYYPFNGDINDALGKNNAKAGTKTPGFTDLGLEGQALVLGGGASLSLGKLPELANGCTFAFWFRTPAIQSADPPLISNKNWESGLNKGIALLANYGEPSGNRLSLNIADGTNRDDIGPLEYYPDSRWRFAAFTIDRAGNALLYLGDTDGNLAFVSDSILEMTALDTDLDWRVGQDGMGAYKATPNNVKMDDLRIWSRSLTDDEVRQVYRLRQAGETPTE